MASGESVANPEPHVVRGLSPILQKKTPFLSGLCALNESSFEDERAVRIISS